MRNKKGLKLAILLFAMAFAVGTAFAATNGMLVFGGTVRINSSTVVADDIELSFASVAIRHCHISHLSTQHVLRTNAAIVIDENGRQTLDFDIEFFDGNNISPPVHSLARMDFVIENTGSAPARLLQVTQTPNPHMFIVSIESNEYFYDEFSGQYVRVRNSVSGRIGPSWRPDMNIVLQPGETLNGEIMLRTYDFLRFINENGIDPLAADGHVFNAQFTLTYDAGQ